MPDLNDSYFEPKLKSQKSMMINRPQKSILNDLMKEAFDFPSDLKFMSQTDNQHLLPPTDALDDFFESVVFVKDIEQNCKTCIATGESALEQIGTTKLELLLFKEDLQTDSFIKLFAD